MYKNRSFEIDFDVLAEMLKDAVDKVKSQENPDTLNQIKKTYKKTVPFTLRMYVAAYLAKEAQKRYRSSGKFPKKDFKQRDFRENMQKVSSERRDTSDNNFSSLEGRTPRPHTEIDPALAATIFISIGRNRRVFARDLVGLLISVAGIERDRIGGIRVLANYSFVQLFAEDADKAINAINGYEYRGRKLAASFSRQKEAGFGSGADDAEQDSIDSNPDAENGSDYSGAEDNTPNGGQVFSATAAAQSDNSAGDSKDSGYLV